MRLLVFLVGEQIIPNLLPLKHIKPDVSIAVFSNFTRKGYERLLKATQGQVKMLPCEVDAYNIDAILPILREALAQQGKSDELLFNVTGGTKPMSIAAFLMAQELNAPVIYFQTEGKRSRVLRYEFHDGRSRMVGDDFLPAVITLEEYLQAHVDLHPPRKRTPEDEGSQFERVIFDALAGVVDEIKIGVNVQGAVEVDMAVRCDNQVGIIEVKTGTNKLKAAIDQLNTAAGQRYLGTYTQKFLVSNQDWSNHSHLKELALAHRITVIELANYGFTGKLDGTESELLTQNILKGLGKLPS